MSVLAVAGIDRRFNWRSQALKILNMDLDFCNAYIAYVDAKVNAGHLPLNSADYAEQMDFETERPEYHEQSIQVTITRSETFSAGSEHDAQ